MWCKKMIKYYWDGENWLIVSKNKYLIKYYFDNKLHRSDGPACIGYYNDGSIGMEQYYVNGLRHRIDGSAIIEYYKNGNIKKEKYFFNGIIFNLDELSFQLPIDSEEKKFMLKLKYGDIYED